MKPFTIESEFDLWQSKRPIPTSHKIPFEKDESIHSGGSSSIESPLKSISRRQSLNDSMLVTTLRHENPSMMLVEKVNE